MLSEKLIKSLGLYVNHKVCLQLTEGEELLTRDLLGYTEDEVILSTGEAEEERIPFARLEDVFYKGYITSYRRENRTGWIDDTYSFWIEDCVQNRAEKDLLRQSEYEYGVFCHLVVRQDKSGTGMVRIVAEDVCLEQEPHHVLPMQLLTQEPFLYRLRRREDQIGVLEQKGTKYALCYEGEKTSYFVKGAIADILKCPKVNDYVTVFYKKDIYGVVASVERDSFYVITAEDTIRIPYKECKRIRHWGKVVEERLPSGEKQFLIDGVYPVTEECRKGYGKGRGKTGLRHGMTVSYILGVDKDGCFVREYSVEAENTEFRVGVITSTEILDRGYIGSFYERGTETRNEDAKAYFLEEDLEQQIPFDLLHYIYVVKYDTLTLQGVPRVIALKVLEIYDRAYVSSIEVKEDGEVCVVPRECDELYYYVNHEVLVVRKGRGDIVQGRCIHIDETGKKLVLLCGDGKESMYRAIAFEEIATVRKLDRLGTFGGQGEEILEEKQVEILDYCEKKGYLVMNRDAYESENPAKKVCYYQPLGKQAESEGSMLNFYRYDYPATVRVSVRNGELHKTLEIGEGAEKQDRSEFLPVVNKRRGYGFVIIFNKQSG